MDQASNYQFTENSTEKKLNATQGYNQKNLERGNFRTNNIVY